MKVALETRILDSRDQAVLANVAPDVFDSALDPGLVGEFLTVPSVMFTFKLGRT